MRSYAGGDSLSEYVPPISLVLGGVPQTPLSCAVELFAAQVPSAQMWRHLELSVSGTPNGTPYVDRPLAMASRRWLSRKTRPRQCPMKGVYMGHSCHDRAPHRVCARLHR